MFRVIAFILYSFIAVLIVSCNRNEPSEFVPCKIEATFIHHSSAPPLESFAEDNPFIINSIQEYYDILDLWGIKTPPFAFNSDLSSIIAIQRHIDYDIQSENIDFLVSPEKGIFNISYTLSSDITKSHDYYELILCCIPKLNPNFPIYIRTEIYSSLVKYRS